MKLEFIRRKIGVVAAALVALLAFAVVSRAQGTNPNFVPGKEDQANQDQQLKQRALNQSAQAPAAPKVDPKEEAAYKAFYDADRQNPDARIQLGTAFLQAYPTSHYAESVYAGLTQAYYQKQDWKNFYADADKALALNPDDAPLLTMVGWVIPHALDTSDPDAAAKNLDKAEQYEKHSLDLIAALQKPATMTDDQFTQYKAALLSQAHSGLGLVYYRRQQAENSAKELQQATQIAPKPDPTDYFVLGVDLQNLNRNSEAVDAFNHCAEVPGSLQDRCKQSADTAKKQASQPK